MDNYEKRVRRLLKTIDDFFETRGSNALDLQEQINWINAYHKKLDAERHDEAEKRQMKLKL